MERSKARKGERNLALNDLGFEHLETIMGLDEGMDDMGFIPLDIETTNQNSNQNSVDNALNIK